MAERIDRVTRVDTPLDTSVVREREIREPDREVATETATEPKSNVASRVIWYIAGVLLAILALRFVLALLGANPSNGFANFIYSVSHPFVAPFFSLFGYNMQYGISRFEVFTLVAMAVYALIAYALDKLITIGQPRTTVR